MPAPLQTKPCCVVSSTRWNGGEEARRISVVGFTTEFYKYSGAADLVITRAGATTIAELAAQKKAVVLIPAPFLAAGHQLHNAEALAKHGAVEMLSNDVPAEELLSELKELLSSPARRKELGETLGRFAKPHAAQELSEVVLEVADRGINR